MRSYRITVPQSLNSPTSKRTAEINQSRYTIPLVPTIPNASDGEFPCVNGGFVIENPPYKIDTILYIGTPKELYMYLKSKLKVSLDLDTIDFSSASGITLPMTRKDGSSFVLIWLARMDFTPVTLSPLVHEVIHATIYILKMTGMKAKIFDTDEGEDADDEGIANAADSMFENIIDKLMRKYLAKSRTNDGKKTLVRSRRK